MQTDGYEGQAYYVLGICAFVALACLSLFYWSSFMRQSESQAKAERGRLLITSWLEDQKMGGDGFQYWGPNIIGTQPERSKLYSVRSYEVLQCNSSRVIVRVDSSNAAGMQITKNWYIQTSGCWSDDNKFRDPLHITSVEEAN